MARSGSVYEKEVIDSTTRPWESYRYNVWLRPSGIVKVFRVGSSPDLAGMVVFPPARLLVARAGIAARAAARRVNRDLRLNDEEFMMIVMK
jgi:hypothetical protein